MTTVGPLCDGPMTSDTTQHSDQGEKPNAGQVCGNTVMALVDRRAADGIDRLVIGTGPIRLPDQFLYQEPEPVVSGSAQVAVRGDHALLQSRLGHTAR